MRLFNKEEVMWYQKEFKELELKEFYEIVQLRLETFVVEQTRIYNDLDDVDYRSIHLFIKIGKDVWMLMLAYSQRD